MFPEENREQWPPISVCLNLNGIFKMQKMSSDQSPYCTIKATTYSQESYKGSVQSALLQNILIFPSFFLLDLRRQPEINFSQQKLLTQIPIRLDCWNWGCKEYSRSPKRTHSRWPPNVQTWEELGCEKPGMRNELKTWLISWIKGWKAEVQQKFLVKQCWVIT